ncbi:MAG: acetate--CoA ligase, partial [Thermoplasmata archaeon]|nr:acetate--CoA ligase [Thermoplasmata archaeon]
DLLTWDAPWSEILDTSRAPFYRWFVGGRLNASANCLDRHLGRRGDAAAFTFLGEPEEEPPLVVSYRELHRRVNEFAALLQVRCGLRAGDRATIHLPMTPELPISMLACARLGVVHSVVFAGFSGEAVGHRIADSRSRLLITMDGYWRGGRFLEHKANADVAVRTASAEGVEVEKVLVWQRYPDQYRSSAPDARGRDLRILDELPAFRGAHIPPVPMPADAPLFLMYTSGTTGRPKGCQHSTGGYLAYAAGTSRWIEDIHPDDVYWCLADIGWITGHSYIVYGPLALGAQSLLYEGVPTYPDVGRVWRIAERFRVTILHTSPTAIRQLRKLGPEEPLRHDLRFKCLTTVGEAIEPETWRWYYEVVGRRHAAITDTWWQTETGGILITTKPGLDRMKPGSAGPGVPGIHPVILDDHGAEIPAGSNRAGNLCIRAPWPGLMQTIWGDPERYTSDYFARYNRDPTSTDWRDWPYCAGDGALLARDGYFRILGRIDDVINVAGHRLGTKEIESACLTVPEVAEAAAIPVADAIRGHDLEVYVSLRPGIAADPELGRKVAASIVAHIGKVARPRHVRIVPDMPKTRSGKIMRRVLWAISNGQDAGDTSTLSNPEIVERIRDEFGRSRSGADPER